MVTKDRKKERIVLLSSVTFLWVKFERKDNFVSEILDGIGGRLLLSS